MHNCNLILAVKQLKKWVKNIENYQHQYLLSSEPTQEEKQKGYSAKSYEENNQIEMQKKYELYDKYYRNKK